MSDLGRTLTRMTPLPDLHARVLDMERRRWRHRGAKVDAVRREFGLSEWQWQQLVFQVCATPAALAADPVVVNRIRRLQSRSTVRA